MGLLWATACGDVPAGVRWAGTVDTLASWGLVVRSPVQGLWTEEERWMLVEDLRIGALEGDGPDVFGSVSDVRVDELSEALNTGPGGTRLGWDVFDRGGRFLGTLPRPGGFQDFRLLRIRNDALYGTVRGEYDEQYVVRLSVRRGTGAPGAAGSRPG